MQIISIYMTIVIVAISTIRSDGKRGCVFYGHSCFGGHGKRSESPIIDEYSVENSLDGQPGPNRNAFVLQSQNVRPYMEATDSMELDRLDSVNRYAVYSLFKQWLEEEQRFRQMELQQNLDNQIRLENSYRINN